MIRRFVWIAAVAACALGSLCQSAMAQSRTYTWQQIQDKFQAANPTVLAGQLNIDETRTAEVAAFLRPNPSVSASLDQIEPFPHSPYRPLTDYLNIFSASYLHERMKKRELRLSSAQKDTAIAVSQQDDLVRNLMFTLRNAFVQTLQAKAVRLLAAENLAYYDNVLGVSRDRFTAGDIAQVDLDRLELARVQFETDLQTAEVSLRTAKIQLLTLVNDRTPVDQFDVTGVFDFADQLMAQEEFRNLALASRPDLKAAVQAIDKAKTDHDLAVANGSTDPVFGVDFGQTNALPRYVGFNVTIPLRVFDKNQSEKARTQLDIARNERLRDAAEAQIFSDVDSGYATLSSNLTLLRAYKARYLDRAVRVRDTVAFAYQRGGASLLDFLQSESDYRSVQLNYLNLIGAYLTSANQLNLAVGREVIQ
jgi:cobalt-zinc-cadmium efflux system outer membrane protein